MDYNNAIELLELTNINRITKKDIVSSYRRLALKYHPDKNNGNDTHFKLLNEAHSYLIQNNYYLKEITDTDEENIGDLTYANILSKFIKSLGIKNDIITDEIISIIINGSCEMIQKIFETISYERYIQIYTILYKYKKILNIDVSIFDKMNEIIMKQTTTNIYILNPSLKDLFDDKFYKLSINEKELFYVPLFCSEVYFDTLYNGEITVKCLPELDDGITIDDENNLHIEVKIILDNKLFEKKTHDIILADRIFKIPMEELYLRKSQSYIFKEKGITKVNLDEEESEEEYKLYDINIKGDVIFHINLLNF